MNADDFARICAGGGAPTRGARAILTDCTRALRVWEGGLVFYGGVIAAAAFAFRFARREGWQPARIADLFAPALALGHAFGRLGCFAAGCCYGKEVGGALGSGWGVRFPHGSVAFDQYVAAGLSPSAFTPRLHPTQLYEAAGELVIFTVLLALRGRARRAPARCSSAISGSTPCSASSSRSSAATTRASSWSASRRRIWPSGSTCLRASRRCCRSASSSACS